MNKRSNVLWLMTDEQRTDSMGAYGSPWAHTPNLDRLANEGVRFDNAYTASPVCLPARASMLTGQACSTLGLLSNCHILDPHNPRFLTWELARAGYQVGSFGKHHYGCQRMAFDVEAGRTLADKVGYENYKVDVDCEEFGVVRYEGGPAWEWIFAGRYPGAVEETPEMENVRQALQWIRRRDPNRPYFARVSFNAPHTPVATPAPFDTMIDPDAIDLPMDFPGDIDNVPAPVRDHLYSIEGSHRLTPEQIRRTRQCYYGYVACADHCFRVLLDRLREMGELDNTIVVFVSDHGSHLGDHGLYQKQSYYEGSVRVPFFFWGPGIEEGAVIRTPVSVSSLMPTLLELAGTEIPRQVQYGSLADVVRGHAQPQHGPIFSDIDYSLCGYRDGDRYVMIRDQEWKLAIFRDPSDPRKFPDADGLTLHNLDEDPGERRNLAGDRAYDEIVNKLIEKIDTWDRPREIRGPVRREIPPRHRPK